MPDRSKSIYLVLNRKGKIESFWLKKPNTARKIIKGKLVYHIPNKRGMGRAKGNNHERETAKILSQWLYGKEGILKRTPLSGGWSSQKMGDVILDPEMERKGYYNPPIYVECRSYKDLLQYNFLTWAAFGAPKIISSWIKEVESKCDGRMPWLVLKGNHTEPWALIMDRWLTDTVSDRFLFKSPIIFSKTGWKTGTGYLFPLKRVETLGDGKVFFEKWREDDGPAQLRRLGRDSHKAEPKKD